MKHPFTALTLLTGLSLSGAPRVFGIVAALVLPLAFAAPVGAIQLNVQVTSSELNYGGVQELDQVINNSATGTLLPGQAVQSLVQGYGDDLYFVRSRARADYGSLGVSAQSIMVNNTPWTAATRTRQAYADAQSVWTDTFTIASGNAPVGTAVSILATAVVDIGELSSSGFSNSAIRNGRVTFNTSTGSGTGPGWCLAVGAACDPATTALQVGHNLISFEMQTTVGVHTWFAALNAQAVVEDNAIGFASGSVLADAFNSAHSYYTVLTPGATLQSASGYSYTVPVQIPAPVPEPPTYALMLAGLGLIGWRARRRG